MNNDQCELFNLFFPMHSTNSANSLYENHTLRLHKITRFYSVEINPACKVASVKINFKSSRWLDFIY